MNVPREEIELLTKLGPAKPYVPPQFDTRQTKCVCGKWQPNSLMEEINSGVVTALSNVCRGCVDGCRHDRETARIICTGCRRVIARIAPHKDPTGFKFEANRCYHVMACPGCKTDAKESHILEKVLHDRNLGRKL